MSQLDSPKLAAALVEALTDLTVITAGQQATIDTKGGGSYSYKYADLADLIKLTRPVLAKHGIVALTPVHANMTGDGLAVSVRLIHSSGEEMHFGQFPFPEGSTAQATGSAVTYHRRYALLAALGMAADDDDDGSTATREGATRQRGGRQQRSGPPLCEVCKEPATEGVKKVASGFVHVKCLEDDTDDPERPF